VALGLREIGIKQKLSKHGTGGRVMRTEEAKMQIQAIPEKIWDQLSEPDREAMEMAFSALQEQDVPDTNVGDMISRQAAIDAIVDCTVYGNADDLKEAVMQENAWNKWSGGVLEALEAVEELPSAQPAPCEFCKHNNIADDKVCLMCSAERRTDD
jgi:hypothetical protein